MQDRCAGRASARSVRAMDSDVSGSSNPGPDEGQPHPAGRGTEDPGPDGSVPERGSGNPGPEEPGEDDAPAQGSENPGPEE